MDKAVSVIETLRECNEKIIFGVNTGQLVAVHEVEPSSFIQVMQSVRINPAQPEPVIWSYSQFWVDTLPAQDREHFVGSFLNELIGPHKNTKIIGIYNQVVPRE